MEASFRRPIMAEEDDVQLLGFLGCTVLAGRDVSGQAERNSCSMVDPFGSCVWCCLLVVDSKQKRGWD